MTEDEIIIGLEEGRELVCYRDSHADITDEEKIAKNLVRQGFATISLICERDGMVGYSYRKMINA